MKIRTSRWLGAALCLALGGVSLPAMAVIPVTVDAPVIVGSIIDANVIAANKAEVGTYTLLQGYTTYMEGGGTGNGVIELLMAQGNQLAKLAAFNDQYFANLSQTNMADKASAMAAQSAIGRGKAMALSSGSISDSPGCDTVTRAITSGGAHQIQEAQDNSQRAQIEDRMTNNRNPLAVEADLVANRALFCSQYDVTNKRPGCASVGALPDADIDSKSLSLGAVNKKSPVPTNHTFTPEQEAAASAYITNVLPLPAPQPRGDAMNSPQGKQAMVEFQRYNARWSPISEALSAIKAMDAPMAKAPEGWNDGQHQGAYGAGGRIFPGQKFPAQPSERDVLYYQTFEAYQDPLKIAQWENMSEPADLAKEQLKMAALQARLQLLSIERQEEQNKLLAALLADRIDPVNAETVRNRIPASAAK